MHHSRLQGIPFGSASTAGETESSRPRSMLPPCRKECPMTTASGRPQLLAALLAVLTVVAAVTLIPRVTPAAAASTVEDEGASCAVPALPDAGALPTVVKLPDPFTRLN